MFGGPSKLTPGAGISPAPTWDCTTVSTPWGPSGPSRPVSRSSGARGTTSVLGATGGIERSGGDTSNCTGVLAPRKRPRVAVAGTSAASAICAANAAAIAATANGVRFMRGRPRAGTAARRSVARNRRRRSGKWRKRSIFRSDLPTPPCRAGAVRRGSPRVRRRHRASGPGARRLRAGHPGESPRIGRGGPVTICVARSGRARCSARARRGRASGRPRAPPRDRSTADRHRPAKAARGRPR